MESHARANARNDGACFVARDLRDARACADNEGYRNIRYTETGADADVHTGACRCAKRAIRTGRRRKSQQVLGPTDTGRDSANRRARVRANAGAGSAHEQHRRDTAIRTAIICCC